MEPGTTVAAAAEGRQLFVGGGPGTVVRLNGNPGDYALHVDPAGEDRTGRYVLVALNGSGEYHLETSIERVGFVSGAYALGRNLPAVIAAGARREARSAAGQPFSSYAQIREDVLLMRALRDVDPQAGFYVDVGAYDPDTDSMTRVFYELGWRGINLEPLPVQHAKFERKRPRDVNLCAAASATRGRLRFFANDGEQLGTLETRFASTDPADDAFEVPVVPLAEVFHEHVAGAIHFLKIDVEGHERSVLEGCDFTTYRPWIVVMEAVAPNRADVATFGEWEDILIDAGYALAGEDELNRYYLADEHAHLARLFAIPADNYVPGRMMIERERSDARVEALRLRLERYEAPTIAAAFGTLVHAVATAIWSASGSKRSR